MPTITDNPAAGSAPSLGSALVRAASEMVAVTHFSGCIDGSTVDARDNLKRALAAFRSQPFVPRDDVVWFILGRPCFVLAPVAHRLRALGHDIETRCEDEQAYVIHWLLNLYFAHGETWQDEMNRVLKAEQTLPPTAAQRPVE